MVVLKAVLMAACSCGKSRRHQECAGTAGGIDHLDGLQLLLPGVPELQLGLLASFPLDAVLFFELAVIRHQLFKALHLLRPTEALS